MTPAAQGVALEYYESGYVDGNVAGHTEGYEAGFLDGCAYFRMLMESATMAMDWHKLTLPSYADVLRGVVP